MMTKTHAVLSISLTSFAMGSADPMVLGTAGIASLLPDIDTSNSIVGRCLKPISRWIENRFPHRTLTHSFAATAAVAFFAWPLHWASPRIGPEMGPLVWRAIIFGYFFGWFGDVFTKSGVAAFYPATSARLVIPRNPRLRLATGTRGEYVLFIAFIALLIVSIHINSAGGLMRAFSSLLAQPESAAALYQKEGAHHRILVNVVGRHTATGERVVMEDAEIVDVEVQRLLVRDQSGSLFEVGSRQFCVDCQIQVEKVRARVGPAIDVQTQDLRFADREIAEALRAIRAPENARVTLSGELTIKDAPLLSWPMSLRSFNSITVSGTEGSSERKVKLREATIDEARGLAEYFATGSLIIKVVRDVK